MAREIKIETVLRGATRLNASTSGNPRWKLITDAGPYETQTNAMVNWDVANFTGHSRHSLIGKRVRLTATRAWRVYFIDPIE